MDIVVLIKAVPEAEARLRPNAAGTELDPEGVKFVLAGYDESAVEQSLLLRESAPGSTVRAISFGPIPRAEEVLRAALALGVDKATSVEAPPGAFVDPVLAARALAHAVAKYPCGLLLTGKQASDDESGIVPPAVAEILGLPDFGSVSDLRWTAGPGRFTFQRPAPGGLENVEVGPPVALSLQQAWNDPRTASLPMILKSRKAPIERIPWTEVSAALGDRAHARTVPTGFLLPAPRTGAKMIEFKTPEEAAERLVRLLREEAKVFP